jgi:type I restriction enzyme, S subunit
VNEAWPRVRLGEVLRRSNETMVALPDVTYSEITVKLWGKGVIRRGVVSGAQVSGRRFIARDGQFILSRIDARNGALGVVPPELDGALVTNDFPLFEVDCCRLDPSFLGYLTRTAAFVELCRTASEGTTNRVRLQESRFLDLDIALPPVDEQQRIVTRIDSVTGVTRSAAAEHSRVRDELTDLWQSVLAKAFVDHANRVSLADVCLDVVDNPHSTPRYDGDDRPCVRSHDIGWGTLDLKRARRTSLTEYEERTRRTAPRADDIVFVREGDVGRCAVVSAGQVFSLGQRVMLCRPNSARIDARFLMWQLMSRPVLDEQIRTKKTGTTSLHVNVRDIRAVSLVCPPLPAQRQIVTNLESQRARIEELSNLLHDGDAELNALVPAILYRAFSGTL